MRLKPSNNLDLFPSAKADDKAKKLKQIVEQLKTASYISPILQSINKKV